MNQADVAGAQAYDGLRRIQIASAANGAPAVDSADLVARALAVLDQDKMGGDVLHGQATVASGFPSVPVSLEPTPSGHLTLQRRILSDGAECFLPIRYFDVQCLVATFLAPPDKASELLVGAGLQPVLQEDGRAVVDLYCIEYRKTDIGPYNEVGLTVRAAAPGDPTPANYVVYLPVTTAAACRAGREIWGYNKFVAAIDVKSEGRAFSTVLRDEGHELICGIEGRRDASVPAPSTDILTFTLHHGRLIKTVIRVPTASFVSRGDSFLFKVGSSKHPMADNLRALALDGARPILVYYTNPFQALLFPGQAV